MIILRTQNLGLSYELPTQFCIASATPEIHEFLVLIAIKRLFCFFLGDISHQLLLESSSIYIATELILGRNAYL